MASGDRFYWDACCWIGLLNQEAEKHRELQVIWKSAERGEYEIITSTVSQVEVFKKKCEKNDPKPLSEENDQQISVMFAQPHVLRVQLTPQIAENARSLLRAHPELKKAPDAIHLATAIYANCKAMHTYDGDNLLGLNGKVTRNDGEPLEICTPDVTVDGPLFAGAKPNADEQK